MAGHVYSISLINANHNCLCESYFGFEYNIKNDGHHWVNVIRIMIVTKTLFMKMKMIFDENK